MGEEKEHIRQRKEGNWESDRWAGRTAVYGHQEGWQRAALLNSSHDHSHSRRIQADGNRPLGKKGGQRNGDKQRTTGKGEKERKERSQSKWMEEKETNHEEPIEKLGGCNAATNRLAQVAA
ncbi:hypothetical protein H112_06575 [Trichophyton rubrum D6]|uniref:Uncharacterized protein n=2 Tax=Trichophyton TaxID=5550 RepID=A0A022VVV3_TRIRU|nr:hypothetical protein H100_06592 [Trichophyton rubrum MR850]EZF39221.1 hypothetical protein H102_06559 [Trichophyton rubrum CBS 100081]EZF49868.1 hypothetical protein H103_06584 [Trichophyton rubrum CBS 288.86]EZF60504.1 hypothetical protein H104_06539 [Trichophyton rubrum CBS 289.86]EZF71189.1 hypothetical protein H105_06596 [Trichophyton soudanense CBS 452.61]EZF81918.1 hypothetical protein H110_06579 [Trichophyton rubrum MR1448]EZF92580.1 hypothetical protein H113_06629 [Trichophyton rub